MKQQEILFLLGSICVMVFLWIAFTIVHNTSTSTISQTTNQAIAPINATFDTKTISQMGKRTLVSPQYKIQPTGSVLPTPIQSGPTPIIATQAATTATNGGMFQ